MQPWSGGRRGRERSSSVVLLGKLSAIVRRNSIAKADPEDLRASGSFSRSSGSSSNNDSSYSDDKDRDDDDEATQIEARLSATYSRRSSVGATPTAMQSNMTMWDPSANGKNQRFQFYPARPLVAAALARPLSQAEMMRRATLEAQMGDFGAMHTGFAPLLSVAEEQEEKEGVPEENDEDEMDNNELETMEEEERRAALSADEDEDEDEDDDDDEVRDAFSADEGLLEFDQANLPTSVRTLMSRIESESLLGEDAHAIASNQENDNDDDDEEDEDEEDCVEDIVQTMINEERIDLDSNDSEQDEERFSSELEEAITQELVKELVHDLTPAEHRLLQRRRTRLLSCAAEQAALSAQDQLTSSVRRLVIQLKDDSDQLRKPLAQSHGIRCKTKPPPMRRRAGSCPNAYDLGIPSPSKSSSMPTPPPRSPGFIPQEMHPGKKRHKKSAFSRIGPRVLETLHLRKKRKTYLFTDEELETVEGARWKIVELAFRFGGKHRSYLVQAINMFFPLLKYGRRGGAHATRLHCNCCGTLQWQHKRGGLSEAVDLAEVLQVLDGRQTGVFRKYPSTSVLEACSFSVVFRGRTLDLETQSSSHRDWLVSALRTLVAYARRQRRMEAQAIAERSILPLEDDLLPQMPPPAPMPSPLTAQPNRGIDDVAMMAAMAPNYKIRTVY